MTREVNPSAVADLPALVGLRADTLLERGLVRVTDSTTGQVTLHDNSVDKTPLMLYTESITGQQVEQILLMQMSTRRLAEWIAQKIGRPIAQATIVNWRHRYKIIRVRRHR